MNVTWHNTERSLASTIKRLEQIKKDCDNALERGESTLFSVRHDPKKDNGRFAKAHKRISDAILLLRDATQ